MHYEGSWYNCNLVMIITHTLYMVNEIMILSDFTFSVQHNGNP
jgi:hypothetical protein